MTRILSALVLLPIVLGVVWFLPPAGTLVLATVAALLAFLEPADALPARAPRIETDGAVYRVLVGATPDRDAAVSLARELERVLDRPTTLLLR